jgi:hypothetical protein
MASPRSPVPFFIAAYLSLSIGPGGNGDWLLGRPPAGNTDSLRPHALHWVLHLVSAMYQLPACQLVPSARLLGRTQTWPAMESYDIIANRPLGLDKVRPSNQEFGRPAPEVACSGVGRAPPSRRLCLSTPHCAFHHPAGLLGSKSRTKGPEEVKRPETSLPWESQP